MSRLRDLDLVVGRLTPGARNAITDVAGVRVGQVHLLHPPLRSGITGVMPHPLVVTRRRLFVGRWALDGGPGMTGLGVAEDLGTLSSPILLAPAAVAGRVYDALIQHGLGRDPGLSTDTGWPPVVVPVHQASNPPAGLRRSVNEAVVKGVLQAATEEVAEGGVGIGSGLSCCGYGGGVGTASRVAEVDGLTHTVGVLVAASGGAPGNLSVDGYPIGNFLRPPPAPSAPGTLAAVVATDAPLIPLQLDRLSGRCVIGLARVGVLDAVTREGLVLGFSTVPAPAGDGGERALISEAVLPTLFQAVVEAVEEAVLNALLASAGEGSLPLNGWVEEVQRHQRSKGWPP